MQSRWYHVPTLHFGGSQHEKKPGWLELFYDLIFVAAFIQLGDGLSNNVTVSGFLMAAGLFVPLWVAWTGFSFYMNRFTVDDFVHRILVFLQMFAVGAMAVSVPDVTVGKPIAFAVSYVVAQALIAAMYFRTAKQVPDSRPYSLFWGRVFGVGAIIWVISLWVPAPFCYGLWAIGIAEIVVAPFRKRSRLLNVTWPLDREHLNERYGLLTIIVLGESFVKVLSSLSKTDVDAFTIAQACVVLLITCAIWWIYFDDVVGSELKDKKVGPLIWLYSHIPLQLAIITTGVAVKKAVHFDLPVVAPESYRWLLCGSLAMVFASVAIIDSVTHRKQAELSDRLRIQVRSCSAILLILLAPAGAAMSAAAFVGVVCFLCVAQVIADMMMAPVVEHEHGSGEVSLAELARQQQPGAPLADAVTKPRDLLESVRKGTPSELRRDLYFYFLEGGWVRFFTVFTALYVLINVFFAGLYILQPGCVAGVAPNSFSDAFYFSVQTLSTIGFGSMSPITDYGHAVVTAEAIVSLVVVALSTGFVFAKASRPRSSILFSNKLVLTTRHGVQTLMMRIGNGRGNEIVDATMKVAVLMEEVSPEGHHMRRLHDLKLVRDRTPVFVLSWTVMHEIDETSPLYGLSWEDENSSIVTMITTVTGHDGTYGQTVYDRRLYYTEDIVVGHKFVDVISQLPDGRLMIDYTKFHNTEPLTESRGSQET